MLKTDRCLKLAVRLDQTQVSKDRPLERPQWVESRQTQAVKKPDLQPDWCVTAAENAVASAKANVIRARHPFS